MSEHVEDLLARRAELTPAEDARLRQHLQSCSQCRQTAAAYARQSELLRAMPLATPPPALRARVLAAAADPPRRRWRVPPLLALAPVAAAVLVVIALASLQRASSPRHTAGTTNSPAVVHPTAQASKQVEAAPPKGHKHAPTGGKAQRKNRARSRAANRAKAGHAPSQSVSPSGTQSGPATGNGSVYSAGPVVAQAYPTAAPAAPPVAGSSPVATGGTRRAALSSLPHPTAASPAAGVAFGPATGAMPKPPVTGGGSASVPTQPRPPSPQPRPPVSPTRPPATSPPPPTVIFVAPIAPSPTPVPPQQVYANPSPTPHP